MLRVLYGKLGVMSYDVLAPRPAAAAAARIATTKIGRTWIATLLTATTLTRMMGMGGLHDWRDDNRTPSKGKGSC